MFRRIQFYRQRLLNEQRSVLESERGRSRTLLTNILPESIIEQLQRGDHLIAGRFNEVCETTVYIIVVLVHFVI